MEYKITKQEADQRFDRFVRKYFEPNEDISLGELYKWIRKGQIKVNGEKKQTGYRLQIDDDIEFMDKKIIQAIPDQHTQDKDQSSQSNLDIEKLQKQIIYEDENRIFRNKPSDIVVHGGEGGTTMNDFLEEYLAQSPDFQNDSPTFKPSFGYRLDKDTTGVLVAAKTYDALKYINKVIRERQVQKYYLTLVKGDFPDKLEIDKPIFKGYNKERKKSQGFVNYKKGKKAKTKVKCIKTFKKEYLGKISLLEVQILTGRMHQIRVHLHSEGFRILGDSLYGKRSINQNLGKHYNISRQMLHAWRYGFYDKFSHLFLIKNAPLGGDMKRLIPDKTFENIKK